MGILKFKENPVEVLLHCHTDLIFSGNDVAIQPHEDIALDEPTDDVSFEVLRSADTLEPLMYRVIDPVLAGVDERMDIGAFLNLMTQKLESIIAGVDAHALMKDDSNISYSVAEEMLFNLMLRVNHFRTLLNHLLVAKIDYSDFFPMAVETFADDIPRAIPVGSRNLSLHTDYLDEHEADRSFSDLNDWHDYVPEMRMRIAEGNIKYRYSCDSLIQVCFSCLDYIVRTHKTIRECRYCKTIFFAPTGQSRFCSPDCTRAAKAKKMELRRSSDKKYRLTNRIYNLLNRRKERSLDNYQPGCQEKAERDLMRFLDDRKTYDDLYTKGTITEEEYIAHFAQIHDELVRQGTRA